MKILLYRKIYMKNFLLQCSTISEIQECDLEGMTSLYSNHKEVNDGMIQYLIT